LFNACASVEVQYEASEPLIKYILEDKVCRLYERLGFEKIGYLFKITCNE
jgi:hypothetical protein